MSTLNYYYHFFNLQLNSVIICCDSMIRSTMKGNPTNLSFTFKHLLPAILQNLQSPLAAPYLMKLFIDLRQIVFAKHLNIFSELLAHVTVRLLQPQCDIDANWEVENLTEAMKRTLKKIHEKTVQKKEYFTAPTFSYVFVFLRASLLCSYAKKDENFIHDGLQIISVHSKMRGKNMKDLYHPQYLPIKQMFEVLIDLISDTSGRVQSQAVACLLDVTSCLSKNEGCAKATMNEIDVLLEALQRPIVVVRDTALRGLSVMTSCFPSYTEDYNSALRINKRIWIACFDTNDENRELAQSLWKKANLDFPAELCRELLTDVEHPVECIQAAASQALASLLENNRGEVENVLKSLLQLYNDRLAVCILL